jgi:hypothetical protein
MIAPPARVGQPFLFAKMPYDPKDWPMAALGASTVFDPASLPVKDTKDRACQGEPRQLLRLNGAGSTPHLAGC